MESANREGIVSLWPTLFLAREVPGSEPANAALESVILDLDQADEQVTTEYRSQNIFEIDHPALAWLKQCVNKTVIDYLSAQQLDYNVEWTLQAWANVNRRGDYHTLHNHPHSYLSGTYYVMVPQQPVSRVQRNDLNPAAISFFDPRPQANMTAIAKDAQVDPEHRVLPKAGMILLWPSFLHHCVHPNFSEEERLSISFNVILKQPGAYLPT
ncbi:MAG: 2OG-Fe(II) oxygenase family protein [Gammaproteobacteria bacterium]|nr:2OG-Fe(II) oxygenase family protein [Gammaproteobacteria bacterium]